MRLRTIAIAACLLVFVAGADRPAKRPTIGTLSAAKILFLGNSITFHGAKPEIGWEGNWGMAASREDLDYVHLVSADVSEAAGAKPEVMARNIADFERTHATFDIETTFARELKFQPDLIVVAIGENVPELATAESQSVYKAAFERLLATLKKSGHPAIFVRSSFWPNPVKDTIMQNACKAAGGTFIDISALGQNPANAASSERSISDAGVGGHPGDNGMRNIADAIFAAIKQRSREEPAQ